MDILTPGNQLATPVATEKKVAPPPVPEEKFFPSGAIAFFIALVVLTLLFWYGIYFLMIERTH